MFHGGAYVKQSEEKISKKFDIEGGVADTLISEMQKTFGGSKKKIRGSHRYKSFLALISRQAKQVTGKKFTKFQLITFPILDGEAKAMRLLLWYGTGKEDYFHFARPKGASKYVWIASSPHGQTYAIKNDGGFEAVPIPTVPVHFN